MKKFNWRTIGGHSGQEEKWQDLSSSNVDLSSSNVDLSSSNVDLSISNVDLSCSWRCWIHLSCQTAFTSLQNILLNELMTLKLFLLG